MIKLCVTLACLVGYALNAQPIVIKEKVKFLALGDSYTIGQSVAEQDRWPIQLIAKLREDFQLTCDNPRIIATTGWRTDQLQAAVNAAQIQTTDYNLVSLLIGVNNQFQNRSIDTYAIEFEQLLLQAIFLAGGDTSSVFVVSIPDYGFTPFGGTNQERISTALDAFNNINEDIAKKYRVPYVYITDISRRGIAEPDLVASDGLHPSKKMYAEWVDRILEEDRIQIEKAPITNTKKKNDEASLQVKPNPFNNSVCISNLERKPLWINFYSAKGEHLITDLTSDSIVIDTSHWNKGMYVYQLINENGKKFTGKLLKE